MSTHEAVRAILKQPGVPAGALGGCGAWYYTVTLPAEKTVFFRGVVTYYVTSDFERF
jgi:hypothetical protein